MKGVVVRRWRREEARGREGEGEKGGMGWDGIA